MMKNINNEIYASITPNELDNSIKIMKTIKRDSLDKEIIDAIDTAIITMTITKSRFIKDGITIEGKFLNQLK